MIKQTCWIDSQNVPHLTREECQKAELEAVFNEGGASWNSSEIAQRLLERADDVINILTMKETSLPRARGKAKPRKAKAQTTLPLIPEDKEGKAA